MTVGTARPEAPGVKIDTIRYYERRALLPKSPRSEAGYRTLTDKTVQRLRFIKHAQALGLHAERNQAAPRAPPHPWQDMRRCPKPRRSEPASN